MEGDDRDPAAGFETIREDNQAGCERAEFIVHFHPQSLEDLRGRMAPAVASDDFLDRLGEAERFAKGRFFAQLDDLAGDPARGRLFAELAENSRQLFFRIAVDDFRGGQFPARIHPHVERAVAHETETAIGIFQLARGNAEIEQGAADLRDSELVEDARRHRESWPVAE